MTQLNWLGDDAYTCRLAVGCRSHVGMARKKADGEQACNEQDVKNAAATRPFPVGLAVLFGGFVQANRQMGT
jgi:hypothetical protein